MMSAAAWFPTGFTTLHNVARPTPRRPSAVPAIPADAAEWLRTRFDWTFGAVWVASERWQVSAETVVAWAEKLRAGGARAGLSTKERTWILARLNDPEQRPTAAERAMARAAYLWNDPAAEGPIGPVGAVAINGIDDAIALLEARLADDGADRTTRDARELRELLLDDLRVLRDERASETAPAAEREECVDEMTAPASATTTEPVATGHDEKGYLIREAACLHCGKSFTARKYATGWTSYCSKVCSGRNAADRQRAEKSAKVNVQPAQEATAAVPVETPTAPEAATEATEPPEQLVGPSEPVRLHVAVDAATDDAEAAADDTARPTAVHERATSDPLGGLAALWKLLTQPMAQPLLGSQVAPVVPGWALSGGIAGLPATWRPTAPTTAPAPEASESGDEDSLLDAFLDRLPAAKTWTARERERWLRAFTATLDLEIATTDEQEVQA